MESSVAISRTVGGLSPCRIVAHEGDDPQRDVLSIALIDALSLLFLEVNSAILIRVRDLRAEEHDQPGK
jgi:hypothetical protein